jgi:choline dehydrogenase-like flavoprotein
MIARAGTGQGSPNVLIAGRRLPCNSELRADVVIVGAGPAGIVTALELAGAGVDVLLVESGGSRYDGRTQRLAELSGHDPVHHGAMAMATRRQLGGTSVLWGGRCVPYDPVDFDARPALLQARWPFAYAEFERWLPRACGWLNCGPAVFDARDVPELAARPLVPGLPDAEVVTSTLERWSLPTNFARQYGSRLRDDALVRVATGLTCVEVVLSEPDGDHVSHVELRTIDGREVRARGRAYVLACGGLSTTRLLLASDRLREGGIGNHSGHLGRWYMTHVDGRIARVSFTTPAQETVHAHERDASGVYVRRRLSFSRDLLCEKGMTNMVAWLVNPELADATHENPILSFGYLALSSPLGRYAASDAQRRWLSRGGTISPRTEHIRNVGRHPVAAAHFATTFGTQRYLRRRRAPGFVLYSAANSYLVHYHGEHLPNERSRVWLSDERDELGMRRLAVDLRFSESDVDGVLAAHREWDAYLRRYDRGRLEYLTDDPAASVWDQTEGGYHQIGTTRMGDRPEVGAIDGDLAVHGVRDLYVCSSSAFPTSGQANPTLTIVAMAARLAEHVRGELRAKSSLRSLDFAPSDGRGQYAEDGHATDGEPGGRAPSEQPGQGQSGNHADGNGGPDQPVVVPVSAGDENEHWGQSGARHGDQRNGHLQ